MYRKIGEGMRVCIIRNAELKSNAGMLRIIDALIDINSVFTVTRNRDSNHKDSIIKKNISYKNKYIDNYEIQLNTKMGQGIKNIFNLVYYQWILFRWLLLNND